MKKNEHKRRQLTGFAVIRGDVCRNCDDVIKSKYCIECGRCEACHGKQWHDPVWREVDG